MSDEVKLFDSLPGKGGGEFKRSCGRAVCPMGDIEFDGTVDGPIRIVITTNFNTGRDIVEYAARQMTKPEHR